MWQVGYDCSLVLAFQRNSLVRDLTAMTAISSAMNGVDESCGSHRNFFMGLEELCPSLHFASWSSLSTVGSKVLSRLRREQERKTERDSRNYYLMSVSFIVFSRY